MSSLGSVLVYGATGAQGFAIARAVFAAGGKLRILDPRPALAELPVRSTAFDDWAKAQDWQALGARH